jgi:G3E family GTPase
VLLFTLLLLFPLLHLPCNAVRGDLIRILNKLLKRKSKFDAIMIETTGLANPAPVIQVRGNIEHRRYNSSNASALCKPVVSACVLAVVAKQLLRLESIAAQRWHM